MRQRGLAADHDGVAPSSVAGELSHLPRLILDLQAEHIELGRYDGLVLWSIQRESGNDDERSTSERSDGAARQRPDDELGAAAHHAFIVLHDIEWVVTGGPHHQR